MRGNIARLQGDQLEGSQANDVRSTVFNYPKNVELRRYHAEATVSNPSKTQGTLHYNNNNYYYYTLLYIIDDCGIKLITNFCSKNIDVQKDEHDERHQ